jgi:hypothetical protein
MIMQFDTIDDHFVPYAESYEDSTFILILHHIQINVIPKYMLHVGTVKHMYLRWGKNEQAMVRKGFSLWYEMAGTK